jgi:hypothetical protein
MVVAAGSFEQVTRLTGSTVKADGAAPNEHANVAPEITCSGIASS